jgi:class 3 adenylate cyclase/tetratricopeptide (TPR) repeat protein
MIKCPGCGEDNPPKFRLCGYCGTPLVAAAAPLPAHEVRKTVTLLFTDLVASTALGERLDSEALHEVKERYFSAMAAEIQRHGGKIEKYIGDAIMAVFGLPRAHEDDALRAVRAAVGMQQVLHRVNDELKVRFGVELANRTGVNTGEVVAINDPARDQKLATGDAVNVTARLEAAAPANEIYIGEVTYRLVRDAVKVEAVEPLALKGKSQPVPAYRLIAVHGEDGNVRRHDTPLVGRDAELAALDAAWQGSIDGRRAYMVTVIADAGVGKTRLVREAMDAMASRARIISGRCLPYGDGITFWPLRGMLTTAAGIHEDDSPEEARARIVACVRDDEIADRLASATGISTTAYPLHEINWGVRRFLQVLAAESPVVALFDDIHWAEPAFLEMLEHLLDTIDDAPVLMLATARHDLLESNPQWGERERSQRLVLQPLGDEAVAAVVSNLLGDAALPQSFVARVVAAAEGNPLYVEQMLSMLKDSGAVREDNGTWAFAAAADEIAIPPTIQALLEARLDGLDRSERATAEPASVIGLEFPRPAVQTLTRSPVREAIDDSLKSLSRKRFIRPSDTAQAGMQYRFDHHLVRDTVYNGLLKRARATMHVEFVRWSDETNADSDRGREFEEILGYHLEQAFRYLGELGPHDQAGIELGRDAARRLASAGRRALERGDLHAASNLYGRAIHLLPTGEPAWLAIVPELGETLMGLGKFSEARAVLDKALAGGVSSGPRPLAHTELIRLQVRLYSGEQGDRSENLLEAVHRLIALLELDDAPSELATAWRLVMIMHGIKGKYQLATEAAERSIRYARSAQSARLIAKPGVTLASISQLGPTPVQQAIEQCEALLADEIGDRQAACTIMCNLAQLKAMNGELESARALYRRGRATLRDLGQGVHAASTGLDLALVELHGGDLAMAEREVRLDFDFLSSMGETYYLSAMAALLARLARDQGRYEEALEMSRVAESTTTADDILSQALWRAVRAPIVARTGRLTEAESMARAAVDMLRGTEALSLQADALFELAAVLLCTGRNSEAIEAASEAKTLYDRKGNLVFARRCAEWMAKLGVS